jgi:hypothetical protein
MGGGCDAEGTWTYIPRGEVWEHREHGCGLWSMIVGDLSLVALVASLWLCTGERIIGARGELWHGAWTVELPKLQASTRLVASLSRLLELPGCSSKSQECELGTWCSLILYTCDGSPQSRPPRYGPCAARVTRSVATGILRTRPSTKISGGSRRTHLKYLRTWNAMLGEALLFPFLFTEILTIPCGRLTNRLGFGFMGRPRCRQTRRSLRTRPSKSTGAAKQRLKEPESRFDLLDVDILPIPSRKQSPLTRGSQGLLVPETASTVTR